MMIMRLPRSQLVTGKAERMCQAFPWPLGSGVHAALLAGACLSSGAAAGPLVQCCKLSSMPERPIPAGA